MAAWNEGMGARIADFLGANPGYSVLVLAGNGHLMYNAAIQASVKSRTKGLRQASFYTESAAACPEKLPEEHKNLAGYIWYINHAPKPAPAAPPAPVPIEAATAVALARAEAAELASIGAQAARLGLAIDVAEAVQKGLRPDALRASILNQLAARGDASAVAVVPPPKSAALESPLLAAVKRATSAGKAA